MTRAGALGRWLLAVAGIVTMSTVPAQEVPPLTVYAAGSLRAALSELATAFAHQPDGVPVRLVFGASGLLKDRLLAGEQAAVFASANLEHPQALAAAGRSEAVQPFARNALCALAAPGFSLGGRSLAQRLLDDDVRVGTSTPKADPSGDYAFEMFERIERTGAAPAGAAAHLRHKALQLTGGPESSPPPKDRNVYGALVADGRADVFITYCTNAAIARREQPQLQVLPIPAAINVAATFGLVLLQPVTPDAQRFVDYLLGSQGRQRLQGFGFDAP